MAKIQSFGTKGKLRNNESLAFGREIETKVQEGDLAELNVVEDFAAFQAALQIFDDSIVGVTKSVLTAEIKDADATSDYLYTGINEQIRIATHHFDPLKKAAGLRLMGVVGTYTDGQNRSYADQIGFTYNFIQELTSDAHKADVQTLGLTEWVENLKKSNNHCAELLGQRTTEKAGKAPKGAVVPARSGFEHAYDALVERFNALAMVYGDARYVTLFAWWNACIDRYRVLISNRLGAGNGGATGGGSSTPSTPSSPSTPPSGDRPEIE